MRSAFSSHFVNELVGGWQWSPSDFSFGVVPAQFENQGGYSLTLSGFPTSGGLTNATNSNGPSARNTPNWNIDDSVSWLRGTHSLSFGGSFSQVRHWEANWSAVPALSFGVQSSLDPADAIFNTANFQGASTANLNDARALYGLLTGRVTAISGTARLEETRNQYVYLGRSDQRLKMNDIGLYAQDSWRVRQNLTLNLGVRWELQLPMQPIKDTYSTAALADICGVSGTGSGGGGRGCNLFKPGTLAGGAPRYVQYTGGNPGYRTDWNNIAPNLGVAWRPNAQRGVLRSILGDPEQATLRAGYSVAYNRNGMDEFTSVYGNNPGRTINTNRTQALGNLVGPGEVWPVLLRDGNRLGPPSFAQTPAYPMTATTANSMNIFDADIEVSSTRSTTLGIQRALTKDTAIEVRYVGSRNANGWVSENWNEIRVTENRFIDEFKLAQANLQANIAAGRGNSFAYFGPGSGTSPLPIFLAHYNAIPAAQAGDASRYSGTNWTNATFLNFLALTNPNPFGFASTSGTNGLNGNATFRTNSLAAGLPANFWLLNPDVSSANVTRNASFTKYDSLQIELRRRMSRGLLAQSSYTFAHRSSSTFDTLTQERFLVRTTGTPNGEVRHALKLIANYDLPFGHGQRYGGNLNGLVNGLAGGWNFNITGRVQSGRPLTLTGVKLVGMSEEELRKAFEIRVDPATRIVYSLPQDIIDNTIKAFSISATTPTGYGALGPPSGRYIAPAGGPTCVELYAGDCGEPRNIYVWGQVFSRFDASLKKRVSLGGAKNIEVEFDLLNVFDAVNFTQVFQASSSATLNQVNAAYTDIAGTYDPGGRLGQFVLRINW